MELNKRIIEIVDANLIYCLIPIVLTLILIKLIFKNRFETKKVLNLIRWTIIAYAIITCTITIVGMVIYPENSVFINRATGPYKIAYWTMFIFAYILPFTLLIKKLASNFWYVLLIAFFMKIGVYIEHFIIIRTSFHPDYGTENGNSPLINSFSFEIAMVFIQGIIIAFLILGIFEIMKRKKTVHNSLYKE